MNTRTTMLRFASYVAAFCTTLVIVACAPNDSKAQSRPPQAAAPAANASAPQAAAAQGSSTSKADSARCGHGERLAKCVGAPLKLQMGDPSLLKQK
ncbi:hypothetical protein [Burkholderia stagnalis]|uniref:hypothetical protein n=1 Tax=Burkholderia stagnalis TaxID=1503054 RepID=UPI0012DAA74F|nr:hypothetical protein [Burkholderia stagnalis]